MTHILVTGGAGFIGCNFVRAAVSNGYGVTVLDKLTYAGNKKNFSGLGANFIKGDITKKSDVEKSMKGTDIVVNFAAETHVDRSISDAGPFINTNVFGTYTLLEASVKANVKKFVHISTDEVYGSAVKGFFKETDTLNPRNPYSATKAAAEHIVYSYAITHGLPAVITRSSNNFGPYQNNEKFIPKLITNSMTNKPLPIYGKGENIRDWIYVEDNCEAIISVIERGKNGEVYNIGGGNEHKNIEISKMILNILKKPLSLIHFVSDRKGHDFRYALDTQKIRALGWKPLYKFEDALKKTILWYKDNRWFWKL